MRIRLLFTLLLSFITAISFAQVDIYIPTGADTTICDGAPLTMYARNNGYASHPVSLSVDDQYSGSFPIGFTFNFYGNNYTNFVISSNGYITFNTSVAGGSSAWSIGSGIPANAALHNAAAGVYADLYLPSGGNVTYGVAGVAPYRKLVVNFCNVALFSCTSNRTSFQIVCYETSNVVEIHTKRKDACTSWNSGYAIQGVENNAGTAGTASPGRNYPSLWTVVASSPDGKRFTPDLTGSSYTVTDIPYAPIPDSAATIYWYNGTTFLGSGPSTTVNPSVPTTYTAAAVTCGDTSRDMVAVVIGSGPVISGIDPIRPSICGLCDGQLVLHGLTPGSSDTIKYYLGAVQYTFVGVPDAAGDVVIPNLCAATYTNITVKVGYCTSPPYASVTIANPSFDAGSVTITNPTVCGLCNGSMTIDGFYEGTSDTVNYSYNGIPQPPLVVVIPASGIITLSNLCAGSYTGITVKMNSCIAIVPDQVLTNPSFTIGSVSNTQPSVCGACDATITINGLVPGYTDTVNFVKDGVPQTPVILTVPSSGTIVLTNLCAGTYTNITVKMNSCTTPGVGPIYIINPPFGISDTSSTNASCSACDGTITLYGLTPNQTIVVNYTYNGVPHAPVTLTSSATGQVTLTNLCPGSYTNITATLNTCVSSAWGPIIISAPPLIPISVIATVQPTECGMCNGRITIKGAPPGPIDTIFYNLNGVPQTPLLYSSGPDSTITIYNLCEGSYSNFFIKVGPCPTTTITTPVVLTAGALVPGFTYTVIPGCTFDIYNFINTSTSPTGNLWYVWDFGDGTSDTAKNPTHSFPPGVYHVVLTITNHFCTETTSVDLNINHFVSAKFTGDTLACQKNPANFTNGSTGSPTPLSYLWSFGDGNTSTMQNPTHIYNNVGTYEVMLITANSIPCYDTAYSHIYIDSLSPLSMTLTDTVLCRSTYVTMEALHSSVGYDGITWNFGNGDSIKDVNPVIYGYNTTGTFTITSTVAFRICPDLSVSRTITVLPQPAIALGPDTAICGGSETIELIDLTNAPDPAASWLWNTGETSYNILVSSPGDYYSTVTIGNCHASDTVHVTEDCYMAMPNIFTPNGDGVNDYFYPRSLLSKGLTAFKMDIYNRWGQLIFSTNSVDGRGWDGKFNGVEQPEEVYVVIIDATFRDGKKEHHQGNITLLR